MDGVSAIEFAHIVREVTLVARAQGWTIPAFRSPPRIAGAARTIRQPTADSIIVSIQLRGRSYDEVFTDVIEGVVRANDFIGHKAKQCRGLLTPHDHPRAA